ncbi:MAG: hypothetical protein ACP5MZ_04340 [Candidatus Micrarchaeia archaeon]
MERLDNLSISYKNPYRAVAKFEVVKHNVLRKAPSALLNAVDKDGIGELKDDIYREKHAAMFIIYLNSFANKLELMHEVEFEEKMRILCRRASITESVSKDFFRDVIESVSEKGATKYETALEDAKHRLEEHELSNPIIAGILRR